MSAKIILVFCAQALLVQSALGQCTSRAAVADHDDIGYGLPTPWGFDDAYGWDAPCGFDRAYNLGTWGFSGPGIGYGLTSGGGFTVSSGSAIAPVGLFVASENVYEGELGAAGELPFVGTVGVESVLPTAGAGAVNHHYGDGINAMVSDGIGYGGAYGLGYGGVYGFGYGGLGNRGYGLGFAGLGYRTRWARKGCGCGIY